MANSWFSLLPPLLAIVLALTTRQVLLSLFLAVLLGATMLAGNPIMGFTDTLNKYLIGSLTDSWNVGILLFCLTIGGVIGIIEANGGSRGIASLIVHRAKNAKSTLISTWLLGILIFFDDYANSLIVGNTMRGITDRMGVSRAKLAYIVDSTAAPVSSMALISTWVGMELGLINAGLNDLGLSLGAYDVFLQSIPFRFYSLLALIFVVIVIMTGRDFGPMRRAEENAQAITSSVESSVSSNDKWYNAILPIGTVVLVTILGLFYNGGGFEGASIQDAFSNADASVVLIWASIAGVIVAGLLSKIQGILTIEEINNAFVDGVKSMMVPGMILALAWSLGSVNGDLGTAKFLVDTIGTNVPPFLIPTFMFILPAVVAFATGTSWGTNAIIMPIAIPLAYATGGASLLVPTIGAVLTGAVLGDHVSPVSDTTIMSSMAAQCNHIEHVKTQLPYALTVGCVAIIVGFIPAGLGVNPFISLTVATIILYGIMRLIGTPTDVKS